jgi:hypothetical protein
MGGMGSAGPSSPSGAEAPPQSGALPHAGAAGLLASYGTKAIAFLLGGAVGAALYAGLAKPPPARVVYIDRPVDRPIALPAATPASPPAAPAATPQEPPTTVASVARPSATKSRASQLSAERMILEEARTAIVQGDTQRGLDRLERHRRLFPNPLLAEERDALQVQGLVKAGRYDEARASAEAFRKRAPESIFMPMVEAAIGSIP